MNDTPDRITGRSVVLGLLFTVLFAILTVYFTHRHTIFITAVQIPVLPYVLLLFTVLLINPLCRLVRFIRPFNVAETLVVFTMGLVSAGISTFGLSDQLIPVVGSLFNRHWNNDQTEWNRYVEPFANESYYLAVPGIRNAASAYRQSLDAADGTQALYDAAEQAGETPAEAAALLLARLQAQRARADADRAALAALETQAHAKVELFRRGLPATMRAFPGFLPISGEDTFSSYVARLKRLVVGRRALSQLRAAMAVLQAQDPARPPAKAAQTVCAHALDKAIALLAGVSDSAAFQQDHATVEAREKRASDRIAETEQQIAALNQDRRNALGGKIKKIDSRIASLDSALKSLKKDARSLAAARERAALNLAVTENLNVVLAGLRDCRAALPTRTAAESREAVKALRVQFPSIDATFTRYIVGDVPWGDWVGPLSHWLLLILLSYVMLMTFNVLIFRQWAYNEKLIYPLAELPELLAGRNDTPGGWIPEVFRSGLFWTGFAVSGLTLGWNLLGKTGAVPGLSPIDLNGLWTPYIINTPLQGLLPFARSAIFFTMIGLTFLIPSKVSFSLWFFSVLYMVQLLVMVSMNLGVNERSFPEEWWYTFNFRTAEGGGALIVFASVVLWKCRRYLFCAFTPSVIRDLDSDERQELRFSSVLFLASFIGIALILWKSLGANLWHSLFCLFIILVITIGLVRAVTEGGLLGFQAWVSPFHFVRTFFGLDKAATSPAVFAPLMVYYSILFLDIKTFIAPAMANSLKIRDDLRLNRARFHGLMAAAILLAVVTALATGLMIAYAKGADTMNNWFYTTFPKSLFDKIASMTKTAPLAARAETGWIVFGGAVMAGLLYLRQSLFWLPHPIGLIMLVNPIMRYYWFSIFLGWLAKSVVTRYGSKTAYTRLRGLFIGLIAGELVMVTLSMLLAFLLEMPTGIDLNRNY